MAGGPEVEARRLETESLVVGYAMSRLDAAYLSDLRCATWKQAYQMAADALNEPPASFKNLRDEFDPVHGNSRRGWHQRPLRPNRQRVLDELHDLSDAALLELVQRILKGDRQATAEAIDSLSTVTHVAANVAERLLTGRRAEEFFLAHAQAIVGVPREGLMDMRQAAGGFDFGVDRDPDKAIEVKGIKLLQGEIQFTDREWSEAGQRRSNYLLVVVGNLAAEPVANVIADPHAALKAICTYQRTVAAVWRSRVSAAG